MFPEDYQNQVRLNLSMNLKGIISQRLVPCVKGGMTVVIEALLNQGLVRELIHKGDIGKIRDIMEQNNQLGMCSFDQSLERAYRDGMISEDTALTYADQPGDLKIKIQQINLGGAGNKEVLREMDTSLLSISE